MLLGRRARAHNYSRHPHLRKLPYLLRLQLLAKAADSQLERHGPPGLALMLTQTLDSRADLLSAFRDPVPSIAEFRRTLQRRLGIAAEDDRRMRFLGGLGHELEPFDRHTLAMIIRRVAGPQFFHQREILAGAHRAILEVHPDRSEFLLEPSNSNPEDKASARQNVETR